MKISEIKQIVSNKLEILKAQKAQAFALGELEKYTSYDVEIAETEETLVSLGDR